MAGNALFNGGGLERVVIQYGPGDQLSVEQKRALARVLYPTFTGWQVVSVRTGRMSNQIGYALFTVEKGPHRRRLQLSAREGPKGATIFPSQLLIRAWNFRAKKGGEWDLPELVDVESQLAGIRRDRAALERAGITRMNAQSGKPVTWDEYIQELEERRARALQPPAPDIPAR